MPRQRRKRNVSSVDCEVFSSVPPGGVEFISVDIFRGKVVKKRAVENVLFHVEPTQEDFTPSETEVDNETPAVLTDKGPSRSVSVSLVFATGSRYLTASVQAKIEEWLPHRKEYLEELLRREAPTAKFTRKSCDECQASATFRCVECFGGEAMCERCILADHVSHPLHSITVRCYICGTPSVTNCKPRNGTVRSLNQ